MTTENLFEKLAEMAKPENMVRNDESIEAQKIKALNDFAKQYPQSTSGDLQTFVLGMNAMQNLL